MASDERNALAELAEELERFSSENKGLFAIRNHLILHKAQRIIAELDDVFRTYAFDPHGNVFLLLADRAVKKCRAIAEEGAGDDIASAD